MDRGAWQAIVHVCVLIAQSCLTLCNPMDSSVHGILQTRILEWVAISSSKGEVHGVAQSGKKLSNRARMLSPYASHQHGTLPDTIYN